MLVNMVLATELSLEAGASSPLREMIPDEIIYKIIGRINGLNSENNPESSMKYAVPIEFVPASSLAVAQYYKENKNFFAKGAFNNRYGGFLVQELELPLFLYGEHDNEERISEFLHVFIHRLYWGDSVCHASLVASIHLKSFRAASSMCLQYEWMKVAPNEWEGGNYQGNRGSYESSIQDLENIFLKSLDERVKVRVEELFPGKYQMRSL